MKTFVVLAASVSVLGLFAGCQDEDSTSAGSVPPQVTVVEDTVQGSVAPVTSKAPVESTVDTTVEETVVTEAVDAEAVTRSLIEQDPVAYYTMRNAMESFTNSTSNWFGAGDDSAAFDQWKTDVSVLLSASQEFQMAFGETEFPAPYDGYFSTLLGGAYTLEAPLSSLLTCETIESCQEILIGQVYPIVDEMSGALVQVDVLFPDHHEDGDDEEL